jgi:tetratricopeptide (TPR) repeat protein
MMRGTFAVVAAVLTFTAVSLTRSETPASSGAYETTSLLGRKLYALPDDDSSIAAAQKSLAADPKNVALILKLSKAQAGKRQYREAIATCTTGLQLAPENPDLYVERGHRELGLRKFKAGEADLSRAVTLAPENLDAQYHLGMAHYFLREFAPAAASFGRSMDLAKTNDSLIDGANWTYVSFRRAGNTEAAARVLARITPEVKNKEPHLYFYLRLLHFYQGSLPESELLPPKPSDPSDVEGELSFNTINYGVGNWYLYAKQNRPHAREFFERVVKGSAWNSWGFIGSELELAGPAH